RSGCWRYHQRRDEGRHIRRGDQSVACHVGAAAAGAVAVEQTSNKTADVIAINCGAAICIGGAGLAGWRCVTKYRKKQYGCRGAQYSRDRYVPLHSGSPVTRIPAAAIARLAISFYGF